MRLWVVRKPLLLFEEYFKILWSSEGQLGLSQTDSSWCTMQPRKGGK